MFRNHRAIRCTYGAIAALLLLTCSALPVFAQAEKAATSPAKAKMRYLVISPHTQEECLAALDGLVQQGSNALAQYDWGCKAGDHTGYAVIEATSPEEALNMVPAVVRKKAKVVALNKFTEKEVKSFHTESAQK